MAADSPLGDGTRWSDMWWLTPAATVADVARVASAARDAGARLVASSPTLEQMCRTVSPFGPLARSSTLTSVVLGVQVVAVVSCPEGLVVAVT